VELPLFIVKSIQDAFQIGYFRKIRSEIPEKRVVVDLISIWNLRIDIFGIFEKTSLFSFLIFEEFSKKFKILHLEKGIKARDQGP
jgi:hypothetical protein